MKMRFEYGEHAEHGTPGWRPVNAPSTFDFLSGMGTAHDVMEHIGHEDGSLECELLAFGAMIFTRHEGGYHHQRGAHNPNWSYQAHHELAEFLVDYLRGNRPDWVRPHMPSLGRAPNDWIDAEIDEAIHLMRKEVNNGEFDLETDEIRKFADYTQGPWARRLKWLFRRGYTKAQRAYNGDACGCSHVFKKIEDAADRYLRDEPYGRVLEIRLVRSTLEYDVKLTGGDDDY